MQRRLIERDEEDRPCWVDREVKKEMDREKERERNNKGLEENIRVAKRK